MRPNSGSADTCSTQIYGGASKRPPFNGRSFLRTLLQVYGGRAEVEEKIFSCEATLWLALQSEASPKDRVLRQRDRP